MPRLLAGYDICIDDHSYMPTELVGNATELKHIVFLGTGAASYMNVAELEALGIKVHTIKGYGDTAVAEQTIALMLACCRDLARMDRDIRAGTWEPLEGMQMFGKTLGIIGLGGIGAEVARIAKGMGMEVIAWNRTPRPGAGVPLVELDELLAQVRRRLAQSRAQRRDPRLPQRRADRAHEARRDPGQYRARRAGRRGGADRRRCNSGHIRHAGLDVFHAEPLKADHPLPRMDNVTLSAHAAFRTLEASMTLLRRAIDIVSGIVLAMERVEVRGRIIASQPSPAVFVGFSGSPFRISFSHNQDPEQKWPRTVHSITSSAVASSAGGTLRPSAFAVFRLIVISNFVGVCTGRSAGISPRRMRST